MYLLICTIFTKRKVSFCAFFCQGELCEQPQITIISHLRKFVNSKIAQKFSYYFPKILCILTIAFFRGLWYTIITVEGDITPHLEIFLKKFEKSLDKLSEIWYNEYTVKEVRTQAKKIFLKKFKKRVDKFPKL